MTVKQVIAPGDLGRGLAIVGNKVVTDVPDTTIVIPGASAPSNATVQALLAAHSPAPLPGTLIRWIGNGSAQTPDVVYVVDKAGVGVRLFGAIREVVGMSPVVINATTGPTTWATGATDATPITTLAVTNPSAQNAMPVDVYVYHGLHIYNMPAASPKTLSAVVVSNITYDNGGGTLQTVTAAANTIGANRIGGQMTQFDAGFSTLPGGSQGVATAVSRVTVAAGATVTLRAQATAVVSDGEASVGFTTWCRLAVRGRAQL